MSVAHDTDVPTERQKDVFIVVNIPASFSVLSRRAAGGARPVFPCRAVLLSAQAVALTSPVSVKPGAQINASIDNLGELEGVVARLITGGLVMSISADAKAKERLQRKIEWIEQYKNFDVFENRSKPRFVPKDGRAQMILADGSVESCLVLDLSVSGVAVSAERVLKLNSILAISSRIGRIVRHLEGGFAMKFIEGLRDDELETMINGE